MTHEPGRQLVGGGQEPGHRSVVPKLRKGLRKGDQQMSRWDGDDAEQQTVPTQQQGGEWCAGQAPGPFPVNPHSMSSEGCPGEPPQLHRDPHSGWRLDSRLTVGRGLQVGP